MGKRPLVRLAAAAAGGLLALAVAGPAFAVDHTVSLQEDHKNTTAPGFDEHKCDGIFEAKGDDEDGWHFLLNQFLGSVSDVKAYSLSFTDQNGDPVNINLDNIGSFTHQFQKTGPVLHLWLITPAGWTLVDGFVTAESDKFGQNPQFNLSHTCPGTPPPITPPTSPPPSEEPTPSPSEEPTPSPSEEPTPPASEQPTPPAEQPKKPTLPVTGMSVGGLLILSGGLLSAGIALMAVRRRRSLSNLLDN